MFLRLYTEGPSTVGIFRQSANYRKVKELREMIDNGKLLPTCLWLQVHSLCHLLSVGEAVDLSDVSIHTIAALLKVSDTKLWRQIVLLPVLCADLQELLRNVPGGILQSSRYTEFVATNDTKDVPTRIQQIQK